MSLENWIGVVTDIADVVAFFSKFLDEGVEADSFPNLGSVQLSVKDGNIIAENLGVTTVSLSLIGDPAGTDSSILKVLRANDTVNLTKILSDGNLYQGRLSILNTPTGDEIDAAGGWSGALVTILAKTPLKSLSALTVLAGTTLSYDSAAKTIKFEFSPSLAVERIITAYKGKDGREEVQEKKPSAGLTALQGPVYLPVPQNIVDDGEFQELRITIIPA